MDKKRTSRVITQAISRSGDKGLIGGPTRLTGKTKTDVVLEAARRVAEEALLDRTVFVVGREPFEAFRARLDEPPNPNAKLRRALQTAAPWE
ncbi:MAG: DUF1778 domain-containing protein [Rhodospirillales bacterium]